MISNVYTVATDSSLLSGVAMSQNVQSVVTRIAKRCRTVSISIVLRATIVLALALSQGNAEGGNSRRSALITTIETVALDEGVPPDLLVAVCSIESSLNPYVTNFNDGGGRNSHGLCQVQYRTAKWLGCAKTVKDLYTPAVNARCAAKYIYYQLRRYDHYWPYAIAAYNSGSIIKTRKGKLANQVYVDKVMRVYRRLAK